MLYRDFIRLPDKQREKLFRYWVDNTDLAKGMMLQGHSEQLHIGKNDTQMLERVIREGTTSSSFNNYEEALFNAKEALYYHQAKILNWLKTREFDNPRDFRRLELTTEMYSFETEDDVIAYGIDRQLNKKQTSVSKMVLERNLNVSSQDGGFLFYIKTFFPDIEHKSAQFLGKSFLKETEKLIDDSSLSDELNLLQKAKWAYKILGYEPFDSFNRHGESFLNIPFKHNDVSYTLMLNEDARSYLHPYITVNIGEKDRPHWVKLEKQTVLSEETKNAIMEYGSYLKSILEFVDVGMSIQDIREEIIKPEIEKEMEFTVVSKKSPDIGSHILEEVR